MRFKHRPNTNCFWFLMIMILYSAALVILIGVVFPCMLGCGVRGPALFPICGCGSADYRWMQREQEHNDMVL